MAEVRESSLVGFVGNTTRYLFSRWLTILIVAFLFGLGGILYAWIQKERFIARMSFVTDNETKGAINAYAGIAAQFGIDIGGGSNTLFEGDNLIELLKSRTLVIQTLLSPSQAGDSRQLLIKDYLVSKGYTEDAGQIDFGGYGVSNNRKRDSIILKIADRIIKNDLVIEKRDKKLSIIDLKMTSTDEGFAKNFSERLANNAILYYTDYKVKKSKQNVAILERQTDSVRSMLYGNIGDVAAMNDLNVNPARQVLRSGSQKKQVDLQANSALYIELVKNLELSRLSLRKETPLIQVVDTPILPLERKGIGRFLAGVIFALVGCLFAIIILLARRWFIVQQKQEVAIIH